MIKTTQKDLGWGGCCATNTFLKLFLYFKAKNKSFIYAYFI